MTFDPLKEGLTEEKAQEAFEWLMAPLESSEVNVLPSIEAIEEENEDDN